MGIGVTSAKYAAPKRTCLEAHQTGWRLAQSDRAVFDKIGHEHLKPITGTFVVVLSRTQREHGAIGDAWMVPAERNSERPCPTRTLDNWFTFLLGTAASVNAKSSASLAERTAEIVGLDALRFTQVHGVWSAFWGTLNKKAAPTSDL